MDPKTKPWLIKRSASSSSSLSLSSRSSSSSLTSRSLIPSTERRRTGSSESSDR